MVNPRNTNINIRGLGSNVALTNDGLENGVGFYIDNVYYGRVGTSQFDLVDLDRIEVLRVWPAPARLSSGTPLWVARYEQMQAREHLRLLTLWLPEPGSPVYGQGLRMSSVSMRATRR